MVRVEFAPPIFPKTAEDVSVASRVYVLGEAVACIAFANDEYSDATASDGDTITVRAAASNIFLKLIVRIFLILIKKKLPNSV